jgi:hypothetical protein
VLDVVTSTWAFANRKILVDVDSWGDGWAAIAILLAIASLGSREAVNASWQTLIPICHSAK